MGALAVNGGSGVDGVGGGSDGATDRFNGSDGNKEVTDAFKEAMASANSGGSAGGENSVSGASGTSGGNADAAKTTASGSTVKANMGKALNTAVETKRGNSAAVSGGGPSRRMLAEMVDGSNNHRMNDGLKESYIGKLSESGAVRCDAGGGYISTEKFEHVGYATFDANGNHTGYVQSEGGGAGGSLSVRRDR